MNFEKYLIEVLKEEFEDYMRTVYELDDEQVEKLFKDENGKIYDSDYDFIKANADNVLSDDVMNAIHMFVTKIDCLEETEIPKLVAYLASQYYIRHYKVGKDSAVLSYLAKADIKDMQTLFMENEMFGSDLLKSFYQNANDPEVFYENKKQIQEDGKIGDLDRLYNIAFPPRIATLNQRLREIVCNLYNFYIDRGYSDQEALGITWEYFFQGLDPLNQLDELGCSEEEKPFYRKYTLGLIIGDMYEDFANKPLIDTENPHGRTAQLYPVLLTVMGRIRIPVIPEVRERMLKYFILLQNAPEKLKSNRERTHAEGREKTLKKVNPAYILDELTF